MPLAIITEEENKPVEVIKNASEKRDMIMKPPAEKILTEIKKEIVESTAATTITSTTTADVVVSEKMVSKVTVVSADLWQF